MAQRQGRRARAALPDAPNGARREARVTVGGRRSRTRDRPSAVRRVVEAVAGARQWLRSCTRSSGRDDVHDTAPARHDYAAVGWSRTSCTKSMPVAKASSRRSLAPGVQGRVDRPAPRRAAMSRVPSSHANEARPSAPKRGKCSSGSELRRVRGRSRGRGRARRSGSASRRAGSTSVFTQTSPRAASKATLLAATSAPGSGASGCSTSIVPSGRARRRAVAAARCAIARHDEPAAQAEHDLVETGAGRVEAARGAGRGVRPSPTGRRSWCGRTRRSGVQTHPQVPECDAGFPVASGGSSASRARSRGRPVAAPARRGRPRRRRPRPRASRARRRTRRSRGRRRTRGARSACRGAAAGAEFAPRHPFAAVSRERHQEAQRQGGGATPGCARKMAEKSFHSIILRSGRKRHAVARYGHQLQCLLCTQTIMRLFPPLAAARRPSRWHAECNCRSRGNIWIGTHRRQRARSWVELRITGNPGVAPQKALSPKESAPRPSGLPRGSTKPSDKSRGLLRPSTRRSYSRALVGLRFTERGEISAPKADTNQLLLLGECLEIGRFGRVRGDGLEAESGTARRDRATAPRALGAVLETLDAALGAAIHAAPAVGDAAQRLVRRTHPASAARFAAEAAQDQLRRALDVRQLAQCSRA